jgi:ABC-type microcin C transport system permease subunit YejB
VLLNQLIISKYELGLKSAVQNSEYDTVSKGLQVVISEISEWIFRVFLQIRFRIERFFLKFGMKTLPLFAILPG